MSANGPRRHSRRKAPAARRGPSRPPRLPGAGRAPGAGVDGDNDATVESAGRRLPAPPEPGDPTIVQTGVGDTTDVAHRAVSDRDALSRYRIQGELGTGGMATVHAAQDPRLRRELAIKVLRRTDSRARARFLAEAQITAQLQHPNIVPVHDLGEDEQGQPFLAMKQVEGETLRDAIARLMTLRGDDAMRERRRLLEAFLKVCDAASYAHSRGVIHRDLKPANVMLGAFGEVLVMDWGLARPIGHVTDDATGQDADDQPLVHSAVGGSRRPASSIRPVSTERQDSGVQTMAGTIQGTPCYMAPEQALGGQQLTEGCDIHALGATLYTLLCGRPPVEGTTVQEIVTRVIEHQFVPLRRRPVRLPVPRELVAVVERAMARRRRDRYSTVDELRADVQAWLDREPVQAARYNVFQRVAMWAQRHPTAALGASMGTAFALLIIAIVAVSWQQVTAADARAADEARAKREAESEARAKHAEATLAKAREAAARGELEEVRRLLEAEAIAERDAAVREFVARWNQRERRRASDEEFRDSLDDRDIQRFLDAFDRLIDDVAPTTGLQLTAQDFFFRGLLRTYANDTEGAIRDYDEAIDRDPQYALAFHNRAREKRRLGDANGALADYDRALELQPDAGYFWFSRGVLKTETGDRAGALADYTKAIDCDERLYEAWINRALAREQAGDVDGAIDDANRAIRLEPDLPMGYLRRGTAELARSNPEAAERDFSRAIERDDTFYEPYMERCVLRTSLGNHDGAIADATRAIELRPKLVDGWINRAIARQDSGDLDGAIADTTRAIELDRGCALAWRNRSDMRKLAGDFDGAIADATEAIRLDEHQPEAWSHRGNARRAKGDRAGAITDYNRAIELKNDYWEAYYNRGMTRADLGDTAGAIRDYTRSIEINEAHAPSWTNRGNARQASGDVRGAIDDYSRAIQLDPDDYAPWLNRGTARRALGQAAAAVDDYRRATELAPRDWRARAALGAALAEAGRPGEAIAPLQMAWRWCPDAAMKAEIARLLRDLGGDVPD